jgi:hypothetical protein
MKTKQEDLNGERIETTRLAAFSLLVGGVLTAFLLLALILSSAPGPTKAPASEVKSDMELVAPPQANLATSALQRQPGIVDSEQSKSLPKGSRPRNRKLLKPSALRTSGHSNVYRTSVTPGKTPKMTQVQ